MNTTDHTSSPSDEQSDNKNAEPQANSFNNVETVESIYLADSIDMVSSLTPQPSYVQTEQLASNQIAANDDFAFADIYTLNTTQRAKYQRSSERRAYKSQLTDRRSATRATANGDIQPDRRAGNRAANILAMHKPTSDDAANEPMK